MVIVDKKKEYQSPEMKKLQYSKNWRLRHDIRRFIAQMFIEQSVYYVQTGNQLEQKKPAKNLRDVSKARTILRGIKNMITREEPRWQTKHFTLEKEYSENDRRVAMRYLQKVYRESNIKEKIKDMLHNSLMKSIGFWQIFYD